MMEEKLMNSNQLYYYGGVWSYCINSITFFELDSLEEETLMHLGTLTKIKSMDKEKLEKQRSQINDLLTIANIKPSYYYYQMNSNDGVCRNYIVGPMSIAIVLDATNIGYNHVPYGSSKLEEYGCFEIL